MVDRRSWGPLSTLWGAVVTLTALGGLQLLWRAAVALPLLGACFFQSATPRLVPLPPQEPTWSAEVVLNTQKADGTTVAVITKIDEDWQYDDPCGILATALHRCEGTVTYRVTLQDWQTHTHYVWAFVSPYGDFGLHVGERAVFLWHKTVAYQYNKCRSQQAVSSAYCSYDLLNAFQSDYDVLPIADSAKVDSIRSQKR